jgi:hypothetical protein
MNFIEAIELLKQGKLIKRDSWHKDGRIPYLKLVDKDYVFNKPYEITLFSEYFTLEEIGAENWEVCKEEDL